MKILISVLVLVASSIVCAATDEDQQGFKSTSMTARHNYVVKFFEPGLLYYSGEYSGLRATKPQASGMKLKSRSPDSLAYSGFLKAEKTQRMVEIRQSLSRDIKQVYHYKAMYHGVMLSLKAAEAQQLRALPNIQSIEQEPILSFETDRGPRWINADELWDGSAVPFSGMPNQGEGIIVGIIDTGINTDHPSYAQVGPVDNYVHVNPFGDGNFVGHCIGGNNDGNPPPNAEVQCNNKLIGAWGLEPGDTDAPEDNNGHGSHTSSTTAGNHWAGPFFDPVAGALIALPEISGVAAHANIIAYDVCLENCNSTSAGIDRAILDGVDVINFSISGGGSPWLDNDRKFLDAVNSGIFVATSAGNTRAENTNPIADVAHIGPWVMSVAATTHDRDGSKELDNFSGGNSALTTMNGQSSTGGYGPDDIVYAGNFSNGDPDPEQCLNPFPANTWTNGEIVVCDRGAIARVLKGVNVLAGGAGGLVLVNVSGGATSVVPDFHVLPGIHMDQAQGDTLKAWLALGTAHMAEIVGDAGLSNPAGADVLAGFSLRGPNLTFDVNKPDISAPGVSIAAAISNDPGTSPGQAELGFLSGTSMASPHTAGAGAIMKAIHPTWSVSEIKSAMQMTANETGRKEDNLTASDIDDVGNGRLDVAAAANAGLVMDETFANYLAADPSTGGDPKTLNVPSVRNSVCGTDCSWTRVLTHKLRTDSSWTLSTVTDGTFTLVVTPTSFDMTDATILFASGFEDTSPPTAAPQSITITASAVPTNMTGMSFGTVIISDDSGNSPDLHITVGVNQVVPYGGIPPLDAR